jgi:hypothetical protein
MKALVSFFEIVLMLSIYARGFNAGKEGRT